MRDVRRDLFEDDEMERELVAQLPEYLEVVEHAVRRDVGLQRLGRQVGEALAISILTGSNWNAFEERFGGMPFVGLRETCKLSCTQADVSSLC